MLPTTEAPMTAPTATQPDLMSTHLTIRPSLVQRWRPAAFLHCLQTLVLSCTRCRPLESRWVRHNVPQWETATDLLMRQHAHLYIHSLLR